MQQSVKDRLVIFYKKLGLSQRKFEEAAGLSNGYINSLKHAPTATKMQNILNAFPELSEKWLINGEGDMLLPKEEKPVVSFSDGKPYYSVDFEMGYDELINDQTNHPDFLIDFKPYNKCDLWCNARGDSMNPTISSGDIIALKEIKDTRYIISNEIYAIVTTNGLRTIKRIVDKGDRYTLVPDNKSYPEQDIDKSIILRLFLVIGAMKMF